jgi:hypothetical protein
MKFVFDDWCKLLSPPPNQSLKLAAKNGAQSRHPGEKIA